MSEITKADLEDEQLAGLVDQLRDSAASSVNQDLYGMLASDIQTRAGVTVDQSAVNAVLTNIR